MELVVSKAKLLEALLNGRDILVEIFSSYMFRVNVDVHHDVDKQFL